MKRVNFIISLAACFAVLLTSCIKEEAYTLETLDLQVNVTRAGSESEQQGDKIENVMIWAFEMTNGSVASEAKGWRTYSPSTDVYTSVQVHIPLPMCNGSANYRLVAVINKDKFGTIVDAAGNSLTLNAQTTYEQLITARFASSVVSASLAEGKPGTPDLMPISHWTDVTVTEDNIHPSYCLEVDMPVYRALAKTQLFVARNNQFQLELHEVLLINATAETQGMVLAGQQAGWTTANGVDTPDWFDDSATLSSADQTEKFVNGTFKIGPEDTKYIYSDNSTLASAANGHDVAHYICGKILYETKNSITYSDDTYKSVPSGNGYYYKITYKIGNNGSELTRYVPLPPIVRNHDYQVRAFIKEDGGIVVNYTVADWEKVEWNLAFDAAQHTVLLPALVDDTETNDGDYDDATPETYPTISYTGDESGAAVFYFKMMGPEGITWKPTLAGVNADDFEVRVYEVKNNADGKPLFVDGSPSLATEQTTGDIPAEASQFYAVKVVALNADAISRISDANPVQLMIAHAPQWNEEETNLLVINPQISSDTYFWYAKSGGSASQSVGDQLKVYIYPKN